MKNSILQNATIMIFIISLFSVTNHLNATDNSHETNGNYLTVRESMIPMIVRRMNSSTYTDEQFPLERINPSIREYIHFYLEEDNSNSAFISDSIWLLGFIGNQDDILFIEQYIDSILKPSTHPENIMNISEDLAGNIGCFAGIMFRRNIEGAESFLKKYANFSSWIIPSEGDTLENLYTARKFYSYFIMGAYQYSKSSYIAKLLQEKSPDSKPYRHESIADSFLAKKEDRYTELMKPVSISEKKLNENIAKYLEQSSDWIDMIMNKQTFAEWKKEQDGKKAASRPETKSVSDFEIVDLSETVEGNNIKAIALDAVKKFIGIPANKIVENILINTKILKEIKAAGLKDFNDFKVKAEIEAAIDNFIPLIISNRENNAAVTSEPNVVFNRVNANITFDIQGSADILKKYGTDAAHASIVSSKTGDLNAVMIRTNDGWLWAPFTDSPINTDSNIISDKYLIECVNKAMVAYRQITQSIIDRNYDPITIPVLDNGKLIPLKKREKQKDEMTKAVDVEKKILEDLAKSGLNNYNDYNIKLILEATLDNGSLNVETGTTPKDIKGYETADLTFIIPKGADAYKAHISVEFEENCDDKGNLKVSMKRINGIWYWNPFGW